MRAVIQQEFAALSQKLARELPLALAGGCRVREDGDAGVAQVGRDVLAGLGRPAEDAHARPGLGEHEGQGGCFRLQDEGQPHASARHQGSQGACRRLGDGHVGARPLDAPLIAGTRDGAPVGGDDGAEDALRCQDRDCAGPRGRVLLEREGDRGRGRGALDARQRAHMGAERAQQGSQRRVVRREGTSRDEHVCGPRVGAEQQLGGEGVQGAIHASNVATAASMSGMSQGVTRAAPHRNARGCGPIVQT